MPAEINYRGWHEFEGDVIDFAHQAMMEAVEDTRLNIHVQTGRLQKSLRSSEPTTDGRAVYISMIMGGVRIRGVFKEQNKERDVDYAVYEEIRHPQMRTYGIPAIIRRFRNAL